MRRSTLECDGCGEPLDERDGETRGEMALTLCKGGMKEMRTADLCARCFTKAAEAARATFSHAPLGPMASGLDKLARVVDEQRRELAMLFERHEYLARNTERLTDAMRTELVTVRNDVQCMRAGGHL